MSEDASKWDRAAVAISLLSFLVAGGALGYAVHVDSRRDAFQREIEERESAPVLAAGVERDLRGRSVELDTSFAGRVTKPADVPVVLPAEVKGKWLLIVPVWNIGDGLAIVRSVHAVTDCEKGRDEALEDGLDKERRLGIYNVAAGQSEQLRYLIAQADGERAEREDRLYTLIRYTDALSRRERWTCIEWIGPRLRLRTQNYDDREL